MSNRALIYRKSRGVSNIWNYHGMPEIESGVHIPEVEGRARAREQWVAWYEDITTWTFHVLKAWNDRKSIVRILYTIQRSKCWRFDTVGLESNENIANDDPSYRMSICGVLQIDIRYDGPSFFGYESFDWSRIVSIWQHLQPPIADTFGIYSFLLQTDFRYAFPRHQRWFLRTPTSQHL